MRKRKKRERSIREKRSFTKKNLLREEKKNNRVLFFFLLMTLIIVVVILIANIYHIKTITVEGNLHYTNDQIIGMVMKNRLDQNSLYLSLKYRKKDIRGIPFIEKISVDILAPDEIKIVVYEKAVAGYIEYLGKYMYFDKDGIIVETSMEKTESVPEITGLNFDYIVLHEALPVENTDVFQSILDMTQLLEKYEIKTDKIYFDKDNQMVLYFEDIRVRLGDISNIDDKIIRLKSILPEIKGEEGILHMENFEKNSSNIIFNKD